MAYTQADLDAIDEGLASNVLRVTHSDGRSVTYRSFDEMRAARALVYNELNPRTVPSMRRYATREPWRD